MKQHNKTLIITIIISTIHCIMGNILGSNPNISSDFLDLIFLPYSFIAGLSNLVGWDALSIILEIFGFGFMTFLFYWIILFIQNFRTKS